MNGLGFMDTLCQDLRHGFRVAVRNRSFSALAVMTLAIGIGASVAIFSFVDAVLLKPLPYDHADRIVRVLERNPSGDSAWISTLDYLDWQRDNTVFDQIAAQQLGLVTLSGSGEPVPLRVARVSAQFFDVFGVKAHLGRTFAEGEDTPGREHVVVLSHSLWQNRFSADAEIVGKTVLLDNAPYTVIGVIPQDSAFNRGSVEIWHPLAFQPFNMTRNYRWLSASFALLKPGVSLEQARAQMDAIGARIANDNPDSNRGWGVAVDGYADSLVGRQLRTSLLALTAVVGGLLLICCSNVASLALARAVSRATEVAVRTSLGATPMRLVRQFLMENVVLALCGSVLGIAFGFAGIAWLETLIPPGMFPSEAHVELDARVLIFALGVSVSTGILFGIAPALRAATQNLAGSMREGTRSATASSGRRRLLDALIVGEIAVAFLLLCGSGLLIRSFIGLLNVDTGFESSNVLTMSLPVQGFPPGSNYSSPEEFKAHLRELEASIAGIPGVRQVAVTSALPLTDCCLYTLSMQIENRPTADRADRGGGAFKVVTPSYFAALDIKLRRGRFLNDRDVQGTTPVIVVNERLSDRYFRNEDPIGRRIFNPQIVPGKTERGPDVAWEVVGVVANEKISALDDDSSAVVYASYEQSPVYFTNLVVRADVEPAGLEKTIREALLDVDNDQGVLDVRTLEQIKSTSIVGNRFQTVLLSIFSGVALVLAAIGIYGVLSYSAAQRTHEMGVRAALGASAPKLLRLALGHGFLVTVLGLAIGLGGALGLNPLLASVLYNVDPRDPYLLAAVAAILLLVSLAACLIPARRAATVDPMMVLRSE